MVTFKKLFLCKCYYLASHSENKRQAKRHRVPIIVFETIHLTNKPFWNFSTKNIPQLEFAIYKIQRVFSEKPKPLSWPFLRPFVTSSNVVCFPNEWLELGALFPYATTILLNNVVVALHLETPTTDVNAGLSDESHPYGKGLFLRKLWPSWRKRAKRGNFLNAGFRNDHYSK